MDFGQTKRHDPCIFKVPQSVEGRPCAIRRQAILVVGQQALCQRALGTNRVAGMTTSHDVRRSPEYLVENSRVRRRRRRIENTIVSPRVGRGVGRQEQGPGVADEVAKHDQEARNAALESEHLLDGGLDEDAVAGADAALAQRDQQLGGRNRAVQGARGLLATMECLRAALADDTAQPPRQTEPRPSLQGGRAEGRSRQAAQPAHRVAGVNDAK